MKILSGVTLSNFIRPDLSLSIVNNLVEPRKTLFLWLVDLLVDTLKEKDANKMSASQLGNRVAFRTDEKRLLLLLFL